MLVQEYIEIGNFKGWITVSCEPNAWGDCYTLYITSSSWYRKTCPITLTQEELVTEAVSFLNEYTAGLTKQF